MCEGQEGMGGKNTVIFGRNWERKTNMCEIGREKTSEIRKGIRREKTSEIRKGLRGKNVRLGRD